jgi:ABC-type dipeptide/oligopeptide/nickel transport system permease component
MARVTTFVTMLVLSVLFAGTAEAQTGTAPPGPSLNPPQNQGFSDDARQRLILGAIVIVLLAIVWFGRRQRKKKQKSS